MLQEYLPILIFLGIAAGIGLLLLGLGFLIGSGQKDDAKLSPYECGFEAFDDSRMKFDVRYYLVAILFIIFDLEIAFLFPWAVSLDSVGKFGLLSMALFLAILVVGFIYEWKKGALEWDEAIRLRPPRRRAVRRRQAAACKSRALLSRALIQ